jgi:hypothetical protein
MMKVSPFIEIAAFGQSNSQALHPVHCDAMILWAMFRLHSAVRSDRAQSQLRLGGTRRLIVEEAPAICVPWRQYVVFIVFFIKPRSRGVSPTSAQAA